MSTCATAMLWKKISDAVNDVVDHTTLADLLEWQQDKEDYCLQVELNKGHAGYRKNLYLAVFFAIGQGLKSMI